MSLDLADLASLPGCFGAPSRDSGIYALVNSGRVLYVGRATDLKRRIAAHRREQRLRFDTVWYTTAQGSETDVEWLFIAHFKPNGNMADWRAIRAMDSKFGLRPHSERLDTVRGRLTRPR